MKKTYLTPTIEVVSVKMNSHILIASLKTNAGGLEFGGETPDVIIDNPDLIR